MVTKLEHGPNSPFTEDEIKALNKYFEDRHTGGKMSWWRDLFSAGPKPPRNWKPPFTLPAPPPSGFNLAPPRPGQRERELLKKHHPIGSAFRYLERDGVVVGHYGEPHVVSVVGGVPLRDVSPALVFDYTDLYGIIHRHEIEGEHLGALLEERERGP